MIWRTAYDGGRIIAVSGLVEIGAVFPPVGDGKYRWRLWLRHPSPIEGTAATALGAKTALLAAWAAFLISADLKEAA